MSKIQSGLAVAMILALAPLQAAQADSWLIAEAPAAVAISDAQAGLFRLGAMPAVGGYAAAEHYAVGLRMRAGVLRNGPSPGNNLADPGLGGLVTGSLAFRVFGAGMWAELAGGGGLTGSDLVPTLEAGAGMLVRAGSVDLGPGVRYVRVVSNDRMDSYGSADLVLLGLDVRWGADRAAARRIRRTVPVLRVVVPAPVEPEPAPAQRDVDRIIDLDASCATDMNGCPVAQNVMMHDDRIVLEERVLFDFGRARVRSAGRAVIGQIARTWAQHPEWVRITVEGHADVRGSDAFNLELSERRARQVRNALISGGAAPESTESVGHGRAAPRDPGKTEKAHHRNRRVEFVIHRTVAP